MPFQEVTDLSPDNTIALGGTNRKTGKKNATQVEGYYLGSRKVEDRKKKSGFSYIHVFQTANGTVGVWGKTDLDRKILGVPAGTMTRASFDRMVPTPNGDMYKFKVAVDKDNVIEVVGGAGDTLGNDGYADDAGNLSEETAAYASDEGDYGRTDDGDEDAAQAAALQAAERKAKVEALLRGNKSKTK